MYVSVSNSQKRVITYELPMGNLVSVMEPIDVRECIVCTLYSMYVDQSGVDVRGFIVFTFYVMYVSVGSSQESVIPYELLMGKLVSMVKRADVRGCIVCTLYIMYVSMGSASPLKYITYNVQTMHLHTPTRSPH